MLKSEIKKYYLSILLLVSGICAPAQLLIKSQLDTCPVYSDMSTAISNPEKVYVLDLRGTNLTQLPNEIDKFSNLQRLILANNDIRELKSGLFKLKNLQELDLEENKLKTLPAEIGNLKNLRKLNLTRTKIPSLPDEFANLVNLEYLNLSWNDLSPDKIKPVYKLGELLYLNLKRNLIDSLSADIASLKKLESLNLNFNPLKTLPEEIGELSELKEIDLGRNTDMVSLPVSFKKLKHLEYINLTGVSLPESELQKLPDIDPENIEN